MRTYARFVAVAAVAAALVAPAAPASANTCYVHSEDPLSRACGTVIQAAACVLRTAPDITGCLPSQ